MKVFTSPKQKIGLLGEKMAEMFLVKHGFQIIDLNFSTRFGEIDIIAEKQKRLHFIEIKTVTVSHETKSSNVSRETPANEENLCVSRDTFIKENRKLLNPFQNVSWKKTNRLLKTAEIYLNMKNVPRETRWQADGIGVFLDLKTNKATFEYLPNIGIR